MGVVYSSPHPLPSPLSNAVFSHTPAPFQSLMLADDVLGYLHTACAFTATTPEEHFPMLGFRREVGSYLLSLLLAGYWKEQKAYI
jgi:hypothetical protein